MVLLLIVIAGVFPGCKDDDSKTFQTMQDFEQAKIGVMTGSSFDLLAKEYFPNANKLYYMNLADLFLNLRQEKIDGVLLDQAFFSALQWENDGYSYIGMDMPEIEYAVAFSKAW